MASQKYTYGNMSMKSILVLLGSLLLLLSFLSQQFIFEKWNTRSARIREANADFAVYQSNNAIFNAIFEIAQEDQKNRVRQLQVINYQWALRYLWGEVTPDTKAALASKGVRQIGTGAMLTTPTGNNIKQWTADVQNQIDNLQGEFKDEQKRIEQNKKKANLFFSSLYIIGSVLVVIGNLVSTRKDRIS
jgi:hypothetical protein